MLGTIGHLKPNYIAPTQTFIYSFLSHAKRFAPLVLTDILFSLRNFPIACTYLITLKDASELSKKNNMSRDKVLETFLKQMDYPNCFEQVIQEKNIPLLHAHFGRTGQDAVALRQKIGIPLITSFYGIDASKDFRKTRYINKLHHLFEVGDLFLVLGSNMAQRLTDFGCPAHKIQIQHLGIDLNRFKYHAQKEKNPRTILLYCGRLVEKKGITYAVEAFAKIAKKWPTLDFHIVGDGELRPEVEYQIRAFHLKDRVFLHGELAHDDVAQFMKAAHLFILPSTVASDGDMEGTPTVLLEAQASKIPVISTYHADIPEVVLDGISGYLAPENDSKTLSEYLDDLMHHPEQWPQMGKAGRQHIKRHYNIETEIQNLESIYSKLI